MTTSAASRSSAIFVLCLGLAVHADAQSVAKKKPATPPAAEAQPPAADAGLRALALQVALDRAGFSPGEIDGASGQNTERARQAYESAKTTPRDESAGAVDALAEPLTTYTITAEDAAGPFTGALPDDMMEKAKLPALGYATMLEMLAERFHSSPKLLQRLNPGAAFAAGDTIKVPNVEPFSPPAAKAAKPEAGTTAKPAAGATAKPPAGTTAKPAPKEAVTVTVTDSTKTLQVQNAAGQVIFHAPVTVGSENDPLPVGEWKVNGVSENPPFNYNPALFWDADPAHAKAKIAPGPNNPVGVVWIDLSKEHYGIHGTPEPSRIGYTESHGCIRLTNWDAMRLAALVGPGTKVILR
jgi:lipoprotein-anchoring transpeptidase ErfK/SrfK